MWVDLFITQFTNVKVHWRVLQKECKSFEEGVPLISYTSRDMCHAIRQPLFKMSKACP